MKKRRTDHAKEQAKQKKDQSHKRSRQQKEKEDEASSGGLMQLVDTTPVAKKPRPAIDVGISPLNMKSTAADPPAPVTCADFLVQVKKGHKSEYPLSVEIKSPPGHYLRGICIDGKLDVYGVNKSSKEATVVLSAQVATAEALNEALSAAHLSKAGNSSWLLDRLIELKIHVDWPESFHSKRNRGKGQGGQRRHKGSK